MSNEFVAYYHLQIVAGKQLVIAHVVFFHPEKGCVAVCLGITAALVSADPDMFAVFLQLLQTVFYFLIKLLFSAFPSALAVEECFRFYTCYIQKSAQNILHVLYGIFLPDLKFYTI